MVCLVTECVSRRRDGRYSSSKLIHQNSAFNIPYISSTTTTAPSAQAGISSSSGDHIMVNNNSVGDLEAKEPERVSIVRRIIQRDPLRCYSF